MTPLPLLIVLYAILLPREINFAIADQHIYPDRAALLLMAPWVLYRLARGAIQLVLADVLVVVAAVWMVVAMCAVYGFGGGFASGVSVALDVLLSHLCARVSITSPTAFRRILILYAPGVLVAGVCVLLESILHRPFVQPLAEAVFGRTDLTQFRAEVLLGEAGPEIRWGLMRASGSFSNPILAGIQLASVGALFALSGLRGWPGWAGKAIALCSIFTVSTAAFATLVLGYALMSFEKVQQAVDGLTWRQVLLGLGVFLVILEAATGGGVLGAMQNYIALNAQTAFYRRLIWEYGSQSVLAHPLFGIGFESYLRPAWMTSASIDNHWLLLAVRYGLLPALCLAGAVIVTVVSLARASLLIGRIDAEFLRGVAITLAVFSLLASTVALFGSTQAWFHVLLGSAIALGEATRLGIRRAHAARPMLLARG